MTLHPAVQILLWAMLAVLVQHASGALLVALALIVQGLALALGADQFLRLLRRTRWIMLTLLILYAYVTPGAGVWPQWGIWSPTREGLLDGAYQLMRLLSVLAGLALLLTMLHRERLMAGLYVLLHPLGWLGVPRERIAVRLAITLDLAETTMRDAAGDWRTTLQQALRPPAAPNNTLHLQVPVLLWTDVLVLGGAGLLLWGLWR